MILANFRLPTLWRWCRCWRSCWWNPRTGWLLRVPLTCTCTSRGRCCTMWGYRKAWGRWLLHSGCGWNSWHPCTNGVTCDYTGTQTGSRTSADCRNSAGCGTKTRTCFMSLSEESAGTSPCAWYPCEGGAGTDCWAWVGWTGLLQCCEAWTTVYWAWSICLIASWGCTNKSQAVKKLIWIYLLGTV